MPKLKIVYQPIDQLIPRENNPRTHSKAQVGQIAASIKRFGFTNPVLIGDDGGIIAGHGRIAAARNMGMTEVPTVQLGDLSEAEIRAYIIADNRLAENAGWDRELLALELKYLTDLDVDLDVEITGFDLPQIDILIGELDQLSEGQPDAADALVEPASGPAVTQPGDIWSIGPHRLICGDALDPATYEHLLGDERAQMVFTYPPYNVPIAGHVSGMGNVEHREFAMAAGEMSREGFTAFLTQVAQNLSKWSQAGAMRFVCMDWRHMAELIAAGEAAYTELNNLCVWAKTNGGMGSLYRSQHELVFVFKSGAAPHINNVDLGQHGRNRTNVWSYAGANSFGAGRDDLVLHPTVKPVELVADAIRDCSHRKGMILDAFAGSGSTLIAAERTGRVARAIELDPLYCDVIVERMQKVCGLGAILQATGQPFTEVASERAKADALEEALQ